MSKRTQAIAAVLASIPSFPPYSMILTTNYVAAFFPWCLWAILRVLHTDSRRRAIITAMTMAALLPLIHLQLAQGVFIMAMVVGLYHLKERWALGNTALIAVALGIATIAWGYFIQWLNMPFTYVVANANGWQSGGLYLDSDAVALAVRVAGNPGILVLITFGWFAIMRCLYSYKGHTDERVLKSMAATLAVFVAIYMTFVFRAVDIAGQVSARMLIFIYPLAIMVYSDLLNKMLGQEKERGCKGDS